jgi:hypothetical protein
MYWRLPSLSIVPVRCVCRRRCLLYFAAIFSVLHHSSANAIPHGAMAFQLRLAPGQRVPISAHRHFQSLFRKIVSLPYSRTATGLLSSSASSVVPVANVLACRRSFPPAKRRAGPSSIPTCLARSTRVSRQHTVRLGDQSALPYPAPFSRVILLFMAALSRCMSSPQVTLPHAAHGTDSSCRGGQSYSQCSACCQSANRLCLRLLSGLLTARHRFFSTAARDTHSRLICHPPFT